MKPLHATVQSAVLAPFSDAGVLAPADVHAARRWGGLCREPDETVWLAGALCCQALRAGSVAVDLRTVSDTTFDVDEEALEVADLPWPEPAGWIERVERSPMVTVGAEGRGTRPLRLVDGLLYLERYWTYQEVVRAALLRRRDAPVAADVERLRASLDAHFPGAELDADEPDLQRRAVATAVCTRVSVIAGGPGTGKTSTVARLLATLWDQDPGLTVALCAPTGKAAARMTESLRDAVHDLPPHHAARLERLEAMTMHRLLGWRRATPTRFQHDAANPLPYDVVVVDEASMVSLLLMARLVEALPAHARLVLVGDPDQLASVEAGAALGDVAAADLEPLPELAAQLRAADSDGWSVRGTAALPDLPATGVTRLRRSFRFQGAIAALASAVRAGDADAALQVLHEGADGVHLVREDVVADLGTAELRDRVVTAGLASMRAAGEGDAAAAVAALDTHRLLAGHRLGPYGVAHWSRRCEQWIADALGRPLGDEWYVGRPLMVTTNLRDVNLFNGDTGVVVATPDGPRAAFLRGREVLTFSPAALSDVSTLWAMTVHKSQGSQFQHVSLVLPPADSPLLTRELFYTAVTRARRGVTVYGSDDAVRLAVERPARRASGLASRLSRPDRASDR